MYCLLLVACHWYHVTGHFYTADAWCPWTTLGNVFFNASFISSFNLFCIKTGERHIMLLAKANNLVCLVRCTKWLSKVLQMHNLHICRMKTAIKYQSFSMVTAIIVEKFIGMIHNSVQLNLYTVINFQKLQSKQYESKDRLTRVLKPSTFCHFFTGSSII